MPPSSPPAAPTWSTLLLRPETPLGGSGATCAPPEEGALPRAPGPDPLAFESLGGLLALDPAVTGVQHHDADTWDEAREPALTLYTTPESADALARRARALAEDLGLSLHVTRSDHSGDAHLDAWRAFHRPATYGAARGTPLLVRPSWHAREPGDPELEVVLDPGRAFGTGRHESTRLCLEWLCTQAPGASPRVLDLGCGSGILALAAARVFGARVLAVDTDPEATATTAENAADNGLEIETLTGDLANVPPGHFDLILANIRPQVLRPLASDLVARLSPDGAMVLSGILAEEAPAVVRAYEAAGAHLRPAGALEGWVALEVRRTGGGE